MDREPCNHSDDLAAEVWPTADRTARRIRYLSLIYTCFFFISPWYQHSLVRWLGLALFYAVFLTIYLTMPHVPVRWQRVLLVLLFAIAYAYFPFNLSASGAFVFPVVIASYMFRPRIFVGILAAQIAGILLEAWILNLDAWGVAYGVFFVLSIGGSNLFYAEQQRTSNILRKANREIELLAQTAERERIARDLHDLLGHTLTVIALKSELAQRLAIQNPQRAQAEMIEVEQTARRALAEVRETVLGYRSEGLPAEIDRARQALSSAGVQLTATLEPIPVDNDRGNILSLALREAVTNIVRHAEASVCRVELRQQGSTLHFAVEDNGRGWQGKEGNGLRGMRERVTAIGGHLRVGHALASTPAGLRIDLDLPL